MSASRAAVLLTGLAMGAAVASGPVAAAPPRPDPGCPALWVLAVQGTGQSSPDASRTDDVGMLGALLGPVVAVAPNLVQRSYIPYEAGFGGAPGAGGGPAPYVRSVTDVIADLDAEAQRVVDQCPNAELALAGYSQGAQAVSQVARATGEGSGPVPAEKIAAVALYANPERTPGSPPLAGRPGQLTPDPAPGTSGAAVSTVRVGATSASGSGIADDGASFGSLAGRVLDVCADGDLACSAPEHADLLRIAGRIAAQADLSNPVAAASSLQQLLSDALGSAWTTVVSDDIAVGPASVDYQPRESLSQRVIDAADPRVPGPNLDRAREAAGRWNEITATLAAHPGELVKLAGQLAAAVGQLAADNSDVLSAAVWARLAATVPLHDGYAASGALASGSAWLVAVAHDLAGGQ